MKRRLSLAKPRVDAIAAGQFVRASLEEPVWMPDGNLAASVLLGRTDAGLVAFANLCRHQPLGLDEAGLVRVSPDGLHLVCHSHGALFRIHDGLCVAGPCVGLSLFRARVVLGEEAVGIDL